jgi:hypothetical protein
MPSGASVSGCGFVGGHTPRTNEKRMQQQGLAPRVPRGDDPGLRPELFAITQQLQQRVVHTAKQELAHPLDMGQPQVVELMRHGKDDMVVLAAQQPRLLLGQPTFTLHPGTWRAQSMPTGVVPDPFVRRE